MEALPSVSIALVHVQGGSGGGGGIHGPASLSSSPSNRTFLKATACFSGDRLRFEAVDPPELCFELLEFFEETDFEESDFELFDPRFFFRSFSFEVHTDSILLGEALGERGR